MNDNVYVFCAIGLSALATYFLRSAPFLFFRDKKLPDWLESTGALLPCAIMAVLVVYVLKDAGAEGMYGLVSRLVSVAVTGIVYILSRRSWLAIVLGTTLCVILLNIA